MQATNGEYFAATVYDEGSAQYALYTWKDGQDAVQVSKNAYDKDIGYITNKGKVIYSDVEVVNEEGGLGAMQLYVYDASGKLTLIEGQLKEYFVYAAEEKIACYNKNKYCICMIMMRIKKKMNYLTVSEACMQKVRRQITFLRQRQIR